jgi:hypothetical protein
MPCLRGTEVLDNATDIPSVRRPPKVTPKLVFLRTRCAKGVLKIAVTQETDRRPRTVAFAHEVLTWLEQKNYPGESTLVSLTLRAVSMRIFRYGWQWLARQSPFDKTCQKIRKRSDVLFDARVFECGHVALAFR